uniref:Uncharacterized protein n=1 Tax=Panstrongylus megistus TaxID=65343 RepID=A0A069DPH4_9HEMI
MGKSNKAITKCCPFCELQVAVACKSCPGCKHSFYNAKRMSLAQAVIVGEGCRRRTERVKREKPNYYDASEYEKKTKKKRLERNSVDIPKERGRPRVGEPYKKKAIKKKKITTGGIKAVGKESEDDEGLLVLTADKARQCSIILAELNRKFIATTFRT